MPDYTIAVVSDTIRVLETFLDGRSELGLAEVTRASGLSKNKAFRILSTLERHRLVERHDGASYQLGVRLLEFGQRVQDQLDLLKASRTVLDRLVEETQESIFLGVIDGREALCVDMRESPHSVRLFARVGRRAPLYAGGVPKVLLAFLPDEERRTFLRDVHPEPITPYTITDRPKLERLLQDIRTRGYLVTSDDLDVGAHSIAAPIRDHQGRVVAAISVAGPSNRFTAERIERYVELIIEGTQEISGRLGHGRSHPRQPSETESH